MLSPTLCSLVNFAVWAFLAAKSLDLAPLPGILDVSLATCARQTLTHTPPLMITLLTVDPLVCQRSLASAVLQVSYRRV